MKRSLSTKSGLREAFRLVPLQNISKSDFPNIPISNEFLRGNYLQRLFDGTISSHTFSREITRWISDPEYAIQLWYEYAGKDNPLENIVNSAFSRLERSLQDINLLSERVSKIRREMKDLQSNYYRLRSKSNLPKKVLGSITPHPLPSTPSITPEILDFSSLLGPGRSAHFNFYLNSVLQNRVKPVVSDFGDLLHLIYLPDVDLIRCDKRMSNLMKNCAEIDSEKIVDSLFDLPERIKRLRADRDV